MFFIVWGTKNTVYFILYSLYYYTYRSGVLFSVVFTCKHLESFQVDLETHDNAAFICFFLHILLFDRQKRIFYIVFIILLCTHSAVLWVLSALVRILPSQTLSPCTVTVTHYYRSTDCVTTPVWYWYCEHMIMQLSFASFLYIWKTNLLSSILGAISKWEVLNFVLAWSVCTHWGPANVILYLQFTTFICH